jgi:hypothetical protein
MIVGILLSHENESSTICNEHGHRILESQDKLFSPQDRESPIGEQATNLNPIFAPTPQKYSPEGEKAHKEFLQMQQLIEWF